MPFISDEDIDSRLTSSDNLVKRLEIHRCGKGHGNKEEVPPEIKSLIADISNEPGVNGTELAKTFGVSQGLVSLTKNGMTSQGRHPELFEAVQKKKNQVEGKRAEAEELAIDAVVESLGLLTNKIPDIAKPKELASIARDMATVADKIRGRSSGEKDTQVHVHLYAPQMKKVEDYEVIDV